MTIHTLKALKDNFIYVLSEKDEAAVIDPGDATPVRDFLKKHDLKLTDILCTHQHNDHIGGVAELKKESGARVWCSGFDKDRIASATNVAKERISLWGENIEILELPGHTLGQIGYYFRKLGAVFPGDTLFSAGCGRLFEGTPEQMFEAMKKLRSLPEQTWIYFGHEYTLQNLEFVANYKAAPPEKVAAYQVRCREKLARGIPTTPTNVAKEREVNPFFKARTVEEFKKWRDLRDTWQHS